MYTVQVLRITLACCLTKDTADRQRYHHGGSLVQPQLNWFLFNLGNLPKQMDSTIKSVALWFPEIPSFSVHLAVVLWPLSRTYQSFQALGGCDIYLNWFCPLSGKTSIYQNMFLEMPGLRDVHSCSLSMGRGQINWGNTSTKINRFLR